MIKPLKTRQVDRRWVPYATDQELLFKVQELIEEYNKLEQAYWQHMAVEHGSPIPRPGTAR
jgi:hypothetical protein